MIKQLIKIASRTLAWIVVLASLTLVTRECFFDIFNIPSDSMENKLTTQDKIIINKTTHSGLLAPIFIQLGIKPAIEPSDIIVFKLDSTEESYYVKRCIALPGQKIEVKNSKVRVNGRNFIEAPSVIQRYKIWYRSYSKLQQLLANANIDYLNGNYLRNSRYLILDMNMESFRKLDAANGIDSILLQPPANHSIRSYKRTKESSELLNTTNVMIPYKGMQIALNEQTEKMYLSLIHNYEQPELRMEKNGYDLNGNHLTSYIFKKDYIYVMGDNRNNSKDSRFFGPIPTSNVTGKYLFKISK
ncbi:signal peptidase I [Pedobacter gandavensis]|uniref:signal peptidase I n=1 Tax=Pedobacter gandavensis TaxID=2679963 RepID=UPI00292DDFD8|nr:signal peptidase I [Pedobacter gandavensis]